MKVGIIADTHFGVRGDDPNIRANQVRFMREVLLPTLKERGIGQVVHLGDLFDRRKYVNYVTARACWDSLIHPLREAGIVAYYVVGNHDCYYRNTNELNSISTLYGNHVPVIADPHVELIGGKHCLLAPWVCDANRDKSMEKFSRGYEIVLGHLELTGFVMQRGQICEGGMDPEVLTRSSLVLSGHFHSRSRRGSIEYVGSTGQYTWADYGDERGFTILDTDDLTTEHIVNPFETFTKLSYDDENEREVDVMRRLAKAQLEGKYVKLMVTSKTDPYLLERVIDKVEASGVVDLQVVEGTRSDEVDFDPQSVHIVDETDTLKVLVEMVQDPEGKEVMKELYTKAQVRL